MIGVGVATTMPLGLGEQFFVPLEEAA